LAASRSRFEFLVAGYEGGTAELGQGGGETISVGPEFDISVI
jgi:hypothetical protein